MKNISIVSALLLLPALLRAQSPPTFKSAEANPNHTVTFRYQDATAKEVTLSIDSVPKPVTMVKGRDGIWTYTTPALAPEIYSYRFDVDGRPQFDPNNLTGITPNYLYRGDQVEVPADTPEPWDDQPVPHGVLHRHSYTTSVVRGLASNQSTYVVYTPPGYDPRAAVRYPVLYLLHGWSNTVDTWTQTLQANRIFDNLLSQGKIKPMIVVMPLGYGEMRFINGPIGEMWKQKDLVDENTSLFSKALLDEIVPRVGADYNISASREEHAIAGLSMGGLESLQVGLNHTAEFAYIGGFSAAVHLLQPEIQLPSLTAESADLRLLWIACGTEDGLLEANRRLAGRLKSQGLPVTEIETPGAHVSYVWRDNLIHFAPLLFSGRVSGSAPPAGTSATR